MASWKKRTPVATGDRCRVQGLMSAEHYNGQDALVVELVGEVCVDLCVRVCKCESALDSDRLCAAVWAFTRPHTRVQRAMHVQVHTFSLITLGWSQTQRILVKLQTGKELKVMQYTHTRTHAHTHSRTHAHTHTRTNIHRHTCARTLAHMYAPHRLVCDASGNQQGIAPCA